MINIQQYISDLLEFPQYQLTLDEVVAIEKSGIVPYLVKKIMSNKYRKSSPSRLVIEEVNKRVKQSVKENSPIHLTIPTGGYKKWQLDSAPRVDWAEFFHLRYMTEYMAPIAAAYPQGVILDYFSNSWLIKIISHYPQDELDEYTHSFRQLITQFEKHLPDNIKIRYNVVEDQLPEEVLLARALKNRPQVESEWKNLTEKEQTERLKYSERNIRWDILESKRRLSVSERRKIIYEGKIIHDCLLKGGWNSDLVYLRSENGIGIIHRNSDPYFLHLATVAGSFVQFWVGTGIIEKRQDRLIPRVLSYNQYLEIKSQLLPMSIQGLREHNFSQIEILTSGV